MKRQNVRQLAIREVRSPALYSRTLSVRAFSVGYSSRSKSPCTTCTSGAMLRRYCSVDFVQRFPVQSTVCIFPGTSISCVGFPIGQLVDPCTSVRSSRSTCTAPGTSSASRRSDKARESRRCRARAPSRRVGCVNVVRASSKSHAPVADRSVRSSHGGEFLLDVRLEQTRVFSVEDAPVAEASTESLQVMADACTMAQACLNWERNNAWNAMHKVAWI